MFIKTSIIIVTISLFIILLLIQCQDKKILKWHRENGFKWADLPVFTGTNAGSGYWSQDSAVMVFGTPQTPQKIRISWPGGKITESKILPDVKEVAINIDGNIVSQTY